jgi:hypothetical protein
MIVERYDTSQEAAWDAFIENSRNAPFLFRRAYMDYHRDRFEDHSLIIRSDDGEILALLPAHRRDGLLSSHSGLTYGGFAIGTDMKIAGMIEVFACLLEYLRKNEFSHVLYKTIPYIYHSAPAEEDRYALYLCGASWRLSSPTTVVCRHNRLPYQQRRARGVKRAAKDGVTIRESADFDVFWAILEENLRLMHRARPVHSIDEIRLLKTRCPRNVRLFGAFEGETMVAGAVIYQSKHVSHAQYIAASGRGRELRALDLLFDTLLTQLLTETIYFDFGSSSEGDGVNAGLLDQKEGFGARAVTQDWYDIDLDRGSPQALRAALV